MSTVHPSPGPQSRSAAPLAHLSGATHAQHLQHTASTSGPSGVPSTSRARGAHRPPTRSAADARAYAPSHTPSRASTRASARTSSHASSPASRAASRVPELQPRATTLYSSSQEGTAQGQHFSDAMRSQSISHRSSTRRRNRTQKRSRHHASHKNSTPSALSLWLYRMFFATAVQRLRLHRLMVVLLILSLSTAGTLLLLRKVEHTQSITAVALAHTVPRGKVLTQDDVVYQQIPAALKSLSFVTQKDDVLGKISPVTLSAGTLLPQNVFQDVPRVPSGYTTIDVTVGSSLSELRVGDTVSLISQDTILSHSARILHLPDEHKPRQLWETEDATASLVTVALPVDEALHVLTSQKDAPLILVSTGQSVEAEERAAPHPDSDEELHPTSRPDSEPVSTVERATVERTTVERTTAEQRGRAPE